MTPWYRVFIYFFALPWDLISWSLILCIRLFWGQNLKWERDAEAKGSPCLTVDLKPNSWPARTWYAVRVDGKKQSIHPHLQGRYGMYRTWGATTLGPHAIFYGPGHRVGDEWALVQRHEHVHSEQGESYMLSSFVISLPFFIYGLNSATIAVWAMSLVAWSLGYLLMFTAFVIALLRGESAYRGSHTEEGAYRAEL